MSLNSLRVLLSVKEVLILNDSAGLIARDHPYITDELCLSGTRAECPAVSAMGFITVGGRRVGRTTSLIQTIIFQPVHEERVRSEERFGLLPAKSIAAVVP